MLSKLSKMSINNKSSIDYLLCLLQIFEYKFPVIMNSIGYFNHILLAKALINSVEFQFTKHSLYRSTYFVNYLVPT